MTDYQIIPDILTSLGEELQVKLDMTKRLATRVHVDVIDGVFADNKTVMPEELVELNWQDMNADIQLMTEEPKRYLDVLGVMNPDRVFGHVEMMGDRVKYLDECRRLGIKPGLGINLETKLETIGEKLFQEVEAVVLMSVPVGFSGQKFDHGVLEKIGSLRSLGYEGDIVVDGGMNLDTIPLALKAGANQFAVNSGLWQTDEVEKKYQLLNELLPAK